MAAGDYDLNNNNWTTVGTGDPLEYLGNWYSETTYCGYSNPDMTSCMNLCRMNWIRGEEKNW